VIASFLNPYALHPSFESLFSFLLGFIFTCLTPSYGVTRICPPLLPLMSASAVSIWGPPVFLVPNLEFLAPWKGILSCDRGRFFFRPFPPISSRSPYNVFFFFWQIVFSLSLYNSGVLCFPSMTLSVFPVGPIFFSPGRITLIIFTVPPFLAVSTPLFSCPPAFQMIRFIFPRNQEEDYLTFSFLIPSRGEPTRFYGVDPS